MIVDSFVALPLHRESSECAKNRGSGVEFFLSLCCSVAVDVRFCPEATNPCLERVGRGEKTLSRSERIEEKFLQRRKNAQRCSVITFGKMERNDLGALFWREKVFFPFNFKVRAWLCRASGHVSFYGAHRRGTNVHELHLFHTLSTNAYKAS